MYDAVDVPIEESVERTGLREVRRNELEAGVIEILSGLRVGSRVDFGCLEFGLSGVI